MILKSVVGYTADAHESVELVVLYHHGVELIGHQDVVPTHCGVVILYERFNLAAGKMTPAALGSANLSVA